MPEPRRILESCMPLSAKATVELWNRRLHCYLGLFFLFVLWLFALTGLLLNHGKWAMAQAANQRRETRYERNIQPPADGSEVARARDVMRQLGLVGEIDWPAAGQQTGCFEFNVSRPSDASQVRVDLAQNRASVQHFDNSRLAAFRIFHTFSGSRFNTPGSQRDWILTTVWAFSMDALAAGLIVMVFGGYYMWYRLKPKRRLGLFALTAGVLSCGAFLAGLL
ncbi:MAG: PepSY-associated TM helix domain-containing protein [Acidobacteriota bacterium]